MKDNAGNTSTCTVNVRKVTQRRAASCIAFKTCESSLCGAKRCVCSTTETTTYSCPGGFTLNGKYCDRYMNGVLIGRQSATATTSYKDNYCTDGSKCGYYSCAASNCPCDKWDAMSQWGDVSSCSAGKTSEKWTECRTIYVAS